MAWQLGGSILAIALMVWVIARLRFGNEPGTLSEAEARAIADDAYGGFANAEIMRGKDNCCALLRSRDGRMTLIRPHGSRHLAVLIDRRATARTQDESLILRMKGEDWAMEQDRRAKIWAKEIADL